MSTPQASPLYSPIEPNDRAQLLALALAQAAEDIKALSVCILDVRDLVSYADYIVVCHGTSSTHTRAIADAMRRDVREAGARPRHVEGTNSNEWVLLDYFDVVAHIFTKEAREEYAIESLFVDAPHLPFGDDEPNADGENAPTDAPSGEGCG